MQKRRSERAKKGGTSREKSKLMAEPFEMALVLVIAGVVVACSDYVSGS